jgi:hypothetical protein
MPNNGSKRGIAFNISREPEGFNGASVLSQAKHKQISAIKLTEAPMRKLTIVRGMF